MVGCSIPFQGAPDVNKQFSSVNNAGIGLLGPIESISMEEMKKVFETNFFGMVRMIKEVIPDMKKRRSGHIVVMSSVMGLQGTVSRGRHTEPNMETMTQQRHFRKCNIQWKK